MELTVGQIATALNVSGDTVRRWIDAGLLPARRLPSGHRRADADAVLDLRKQLEPKVPA